MVGRALGLASAHIGLQQASARLSVEAGACFGSIHGFECMDLGPISISHVSLTKKKRIMKERTRVNKNKLY